MRTKIVRYLLLVLCLCTALLVSCSKFKNPEPGYISLTDLKADIISKMDGTVVYKTYTVKGNINYLDASEDKIPKEFTARMLNFVEAVNKDGEYVYQNGSKSYLLSLPLHITNKFWDEGKTVNTIKYNLEGRIYQVGGGYLDKVYYYPREDGGFYLKTFGANKILKIAKPTYIECSAKWNIVCEYDKDGYLISESFETLNAHKDPNSKTVYGKAIYTYEK